MFSLFDLLSPALKAVLLVGPLLAVLATVGSTDILHSAILLSVWSLPVATALQLDFERIHTNVTGQMLVNSAVVLKTLQVLQHAKDSTDESIWLAPVLATIAFTLMQDFPFSWTHEQKKPAGTIAYNRRTGFLLSLIVAGQGFALAFLDPSLSTYSVLLTIEAAIGVLLMSNVLANQKHETRKVWRGGSTLVLSWIFLQVCSLPMAADTTMLTVQLSCIAALIFVSILMVEDKTERRTPQLPLAVTVINTLTTLVATFIDLLRLVLGSTVAYQAVVIACLAVIVATIDKPWYHAHADFPVKQQARSILDIIDFVKVFYLYTSDSQVQEIMIAMAPAIMQPRSIIHRVLASNWKNLLLASNGVSYTLTPLNEVAVLLGLFLGPVVAAIGILAQVVSSGASFVRSQWFWAASALGSLLFLLLSQLACGAQVTLVSMLFSKDAGYTRVYTQEGQYALVAQLVLVAACIALFVVLSMTDSVEVRMVQSQAGLGGKLSLARGVQKLTGFFLRPSFLLVVAAVFVAIFVALGTGSPIKSLDVKRISDDKPEWLVTTELDVALDNTFAMALVNAIGPEVRIGLLVTKLIAIGVEELNCVGCYCVPGGEAVDFFEDVGDSIFRRRLLSFEEPVYGNETSPLNGRRLLEYDPDVENGCSRGSSSCSTFEICVADLLKPVAQIMEFVSKLLIKGISYAVEFVIKNVLLRIPTINRLVESFLRIKDILEFDGFHPLSFATFTFDVHMLTLGLGNLPSFSLPSVSMPSTLTWVMIGIAAVLLLFMTYTAGLLEPVLTSAVRGAEVSIVIGTISFAITAASMLSSFVSELKLLGFEVKVELASNVWMYACVGGILVISLFMWLAEHSASQLVTMAKEIRKSKPQQQPYARVPISL